MILISAELENESVVMNYRRSHTMLMELNILIDDLGTVTPTIGCFGGREEVCFGIELHTELSNESINNMAAAITALAIKFKQIAIGGIELQKGTMGQFTFENQVHDEWLIGSSTEKPDENWVLLDGVYYFPGAEVITLDEFIDELAGY